MSDCGTCTLCCKLPGISKREEGDLIFSLKTEDGSKPRNEWCRLCDPKNGCQSYEERGPTCREYECLWLASQSSEGPLSINLRPDKSKAILLATMGGKAIQIMVAPENWRVWERGPLAIFSAIMQQNGIAVYAVDTSGQRHAISPHSIELIRAAQQFDL